MMHLSALRAVITRSILFYLCFFFTTTCFAQKSYYEGEHLIDVNKVETLYKYIHADASKPLVIFIPGDAHLARISYGFPAGKEEDFLSFWFHKKGYPFLGVSYPTDNEVFSRITPDFNIRGWGAQVASLTKKIMDENKLGNHVVVLAWGMAGNIEESVQENFEKNHINCDEFIAMSATPPLPYIKLGGEFSATKMLSNHLADRKPIENWYLKSLEEQNKANGHEIIPVKTYTQEFLGNIPVALKAEGYFYKDKNFEFNAQKAIEDGGIFNFMHTPWIGVLTDDSANAPKITLVDTNAWDFIRSEMLYKQYVFYTNIESNVDKFAITKRILSQIPQHFSDTIHGSHLFFVGKKGARDTEQKVEVLMQHINTTKQNLVKLALD